MNKEREKEGEKKERRKKGEEKERWEEREWDTVTKNRTTIRHSTFVITDFLEQCSFR